MEKTKETKSVSVVVVVYNTSFDRLVFTLDSLVIQKDIDIEIIVSDDGSEDDHFSKIEEYMEEKGFTDYRLIGHERNLGTVSNVADALKHCRGEYVKLISPGDALVGDDILAAWVRSLDSSGKGWSFCDVINYTRERNGSIKAIAKPSDPQMTEPYIKGNSERCRWNYVVLHDSATGAAILCSKELLTKYLSYIESRVIYAEDFIYRLMAFDGVTAYYYPENAVLYEFGDGISTTTDEKWSERLRKDLEALDGIILNEREITDALQEKIRKAIYRQRNTAGVTRMMGNCLDKGRISFKLRKIFHMRMTKTKMV